jgi:hypothetical protein
MGSNLNTVHNQNEKSTHRFTPDHQMSRRRARVQDPDDRSDYPHRAPNALVLLSAAKPPSLLQTLCYVVFSAGA